MHRERKKVARIICWIVWEISKIFFVYPGNIMISTHRQRKRRGSGNVHPASGALCVTNWWQPQLFWSHQSLPISFPGATSSRVEMTANIILWFWNACCKLLALNNHQMVLDMLMLLSYLHKLKPLLGCFAQTWCCIMLPSLSKISKLWASMDRLWLCLCLSPSENLGSFAGSAMSTCEAEMVLAAEAPGMAQRLDELLKWPF